MRFSIFPYTPGLLRDDEVRYNGCIDWTNRTNCTFFSTISLCLSLSASWNLFLFFFSFKFKLTFFSFCFLYSLRLYWSLFFILRSTDFFSDSVFWYFCFSYIFLFDIRHHNAPRNSQHMKDQHNKIDVDNEY